MVRRPGTEPMILRFLGKVLIDEADNCWPFIGARTSAGYGQIMAEDQTMLGAHRVAYEIANGPIPDDLWVLHSCDNPPCCNPSHLRVGTYKDNVRDRVERDRSKGGRKKSAHCSRGHIFEGSNVYYQKTDSRRRCRLCRNMKARERKAAKNQDM